MTKKKLLAKVHLEKMEAEVSGLVQERIKEMEATSDVDLDT